MAKKKAKGYEFDLRCDRWECPRPARVTWVMGMDTLEGEGVLPFVAKLCDKCAKEVHKMAVQGHPEVMTISGARPPTDDPFEHPGHLG